MRGRFPLEASWASAWASGQEEEEPWGVPTVQSLPYATINLVVRQRAIVKSCIRRFESGGGLVEGESVLGGDSLEDVGE